MISTSEQRRRSRRQRGTAPALVAVAGLALCVTLAGCAPEPIGNGSPTAGHPSAPEVDPLPAPDDDEPTSGGSTEPEAPAGAGDPEQSDPPRDDTEDNEGGAAPVVPATGDWQEPEDPTLEGPTAAPMLPEVEGDVGDDVVLPTEVVVSITSISTTTLSAETPGEYDGSAVVIGVQIANQSDSPQSVGSAVVSLTTDDGELGVPTWAAPHDPFRGEVPAGESVQGTYVFMVDPADERSVTVRVNYSAGVPVATFTGATS